MQFGELKTYLNTKIAPHRERWVNRNRYFYSDMLRFLRYAIPPGSRVLQSGFDFGWLLNELHPARGVYLGMSEVLNQQGRSRFSHLTFVDDISEDQIFLKEKFDYIISSNVVGSVSDVQAYFQRLQVVAEPHTRIIVTYYNYLWEPIVKLGELVGLKQRLWIQNWLSAEDISLLLDLAGFEVIKKGRRLLLPKYVPLISWFFNRVLAKLPLVSRLNFWNYVIARPRPDQKQVRGYSVSVIVPARNEKGNIEAIAQKVPQMGKGTEIIFVEGGSADGTWEEIQRVAAKHQGSKTIRFVRQDGKGKGDAVRAGFELARGEILMILDADLTVPPEDLPRFYQVIASGYAEYAHGNRLVYPMEKQAMRFLNLLGNKFFSALFSWLLKQRIKDTLCGTKVMLKSDYLLLAANRGYFGDFDPFGDFDLIFGASKLSLKMVEIPVHYKERSYGATNINRFRHGWLLLRMCLFAMRKLE